MRSNTGGFIRRIDAGSNREGRWDENIKHRTEEGGMKAARRRSEELKEWQWHLRGSAIQ